MDPAEIIAAEIAQAIEESDGNASGDVNAQIRQSNGRDPNAEFYQDFTPGLPILPEFQSELEVDDFIGQLTDSQVEGILEALRRDDAILGNNVGRINLGLDQIAANRNSAVNNTLFNLDQARRNIDQDFASRGLGYSGFRQGAQAQVRREAGLDVQAINRQAIGNAGDLINEVQPDTYQNYLDVLAGFDEVGNALIDITNSGG